MATAVVQPQTIRHSTPPPTGITSPLNLGQSQPPIPNKHIPVCPAGPTPATPPESPTRARDTQPSSLLYPPDGFKKVIDGPPVYSIDSHSLSAALKHLASQSMPDPSHVFPWLHGLHPENQFQVGFFTNRKRTLRRPPKCWRGITLIKVGGDLDRARLRGAVSADEVLSSTVPKFLVADPQEGFSARNFVIQTAKLAPFSDIVIYAEDGIYDKDILEMAKKVVSAQHDWRVRYYPDHEKAQFSTFLLSDRFQEIEEKCPGLVAVDGHGQMTGQVMDLFQWERFEMCDMSQASEISTNVWQGPTPDYLLRSGPCRFVHDGMFDLLIEASDISDMPDPRLLTQLEKKIGNGLLRLEFPSSGSVAPPSDANGTFDDLVNTLRWVYYLANPDDPERTTDIDGDIPMVSLQKKPRRILVHCPDGYTESSLFAIAYFMFSEGVPAHEAWLKLHCEKNRNFFAYPSDVVYLSSAQTRILQESPKAKALDLSHCPDPEWFRLCDGSLPSRILPYMYLGNLSHANNPQLLWALGIRRILSIGESVTWSDSEVAKFGPGNILRITRVQDNGIDPLTQEFNRCLEFIRKGKYDGTATLVHCRVGVSRSATICIAEIMASLGLSFPRAYCFVRARRLNVIIQPHLRFVYELMKWEELQMQEHNKPLNRELEWTSIAREIALLNKPYSNR